MRCCMASGSWVARLNKLLRLVLLAIRVQAAAELETPGGSAHWNSSANISIACMAGLSNEVWVSRPTTLLFTPLKAITGFTPSAPCAFDKDVHTQRCGKSYYVASVTTARGMMPSLLGVMLESNERTVKSVFLYMNIITSSCRWCTWAFPLV